MRHVRNGYNNKSDYKMHTIFKLFKNILGRAYLDPPSNKAAQHYAWHDNASGMYYHASRLSKKNLPPCLNMDYP